MGENTYIKIETLYSKHKGYVKTKDLLEEGFSNRQISTLVEEGYLEKACYGHYWLAGKQCGKPLDYKCIEVSLSNPGALICMNSALYYQGVLLAEPDYSCCAKSSLKKQFPVFCICGNIFLHNNEKEDSAGVRRRWHFFKISSRNMNKYTKTNEVGRRSYEITSYLS